MTVEVIVLPLSVDVPTIALEHAALQAKSGFAQDVLSSPAEDVWNDL